MQLKISISLLSGAALCVSAGACLAATESNAKQILATAPLRFEPAAESNGSRFVARGARFHFQFTPSQAILDTGTKEVRLSFEGANWAARMEGSELLRSTTNLYFGNDPSQWRHAIPNYGKVGVRNLYRGIDLAYYGNGGDLEYDLTVNPGADPRRIRVRLDGLSQKRPAAYQVDGSGARRSVESSYRRNTDGSWGFQLGDYDRSRALVIDPVIVAQYFSGSYEDIAYAVGHDSKGLIYVAGTTQSSDIPLAGSPLQNVEGGGQDLFLAVVNPGLPASSQVIYVTYIGGTEDETFGGMTVAANGTVYLTGSTVSANFPLQNAAQATIGGDTGSPDAFVLELSPTQTVTYSTFFGGSETDKGTAIAVDSSGKIWITGDTQSTDLPNAGGFQTVLIGTQNMFVAGFDPSKATTATQIYSIYIGGTHWDEAYGIAAATDGTIWIAGGTFSPDIWIQGPAYQSTYGGDGDAYVAHINPGLGKDALLYASFLGGHGIDEATSMVLDPSGLVILSGYTLSSNFPVTKNAYQTTYGGDTDAFVAILDTAKRELVYSTFFGGPDPDAAMDLKEDSSGVLYVSGYTESPGLPSTSNALQAAYDGSVDAFGLKLDPSKDGAAGIDYFTYLGSDGTQVAYAVDVDASGNIYLAGYSSTGILAPLNGPERATVAGNWDAFVVGFSPGASAPAATTSETMAHRRRLPWRISPHR